MSLSEQFRQVLEGEPNAPPWLRKMLAAAAPTGWVYGAAMSLRWSLYETGGLTSELPSSPVISVGNLTLGGTGKSPTVAWVVSRLLEDGGKPAVVSRGYGGSLKDVTVVSDGSGSVLESPAAADEAVMLAQMFPSVPVVTGGNRLKAAQRASDELGAQIIVVDDGFQHLALCRDFDLVLLRGDRPFGNGRVFPAGALREPRAALRRAHAILLTGEVDPDARRSVERVVPQAEFFAGSLKPTVLLNSLGKEVGNYQELKGVGAVAVSGIGNPEEFERMLLDLGVRVLSHHVYPDHAQYSPEVMKQLFSSRRNSGADFIITTEKDLVKMADYDENSELRAIRVVMEIQEGDKLASLMTSSIQSNSHAS